ncbi:ATP-binding protein [Cellulomonas gilvus]|uniref:histidine kinase n=1 Tax=Cellulomonas gilvus (strain ATCC 13127 / NRRL B-14078) TaxID=593907 RepID=F8A3F2_CELGA|nr:ATP-binding protein [Cellulomonas gilvus]AEI10716.1 integral membrane sensor signal transduction histidine kinase [Cellulomonas gilvus ATCC 13127]
MLRRLGIRAKVLAVLAVPMLVLALLGVYISATSISAWQDARGTQQVTETLEAYQPLGQAIDGEFVTSMTTTDPDAIAKAQATTDAALARVRKVTADLDLSQFPPALVQQFRSVQEDYDTTLVNARTAVNRGGSSSTVRANFETIEDGQLELVAQLSETFQNRDVATAVNSYLALSTLSTALVGELIDGMTLVSGSYSPTLGGVYGDTVQQVEIMRADAAAALYRVSGLDATMPSNQPSSAFIAMRTLLSAGTADTVTKVDPAKYGADIEEQTTALVALAGQSIAHAQELAADEAAAARNQAILTIAATILAAAASLLLALVVARSIVTPLRRLTSAASDVRERLPRIVEQVATPGEQPDVQLDPIPVTSRDEVGRLAQAFNSMNATTVRVAQEQAMLRGSIAEMFVNVARRDQVLLNRQLSFIDSLERSEEDPNTLANLFRLDHLATRMRRNAESLLVLAGIDSGRRLRDTMPLSDVIRTASSEIEQYDRIELDLQIDPHMLGFNALPAAHLLAELLENATVFSEPETPVTVTTGVSGQFVVVRVRDHGLGMTEDEIRAANAKIASSAAGDALGAQRLGLFVVGRIAQKLGAAVRLAKAEGGTGTDTTVLFPATLFASTETDTYGAPGVAQEMALDAAAAPEVAPVDLTALTDGETALGLPRRRRVEGEAESGAIPVTQVGLPTRGGGELPTRGGDLPARPRKTFDEDNIVLPEAPAATLSPDLSTAAPDWRPAALESTGGGLPSRSGRTSAWQAPEPVADEPVAPAAPASPAARAGLFSGFRGRSAAEGGVPGLAADGDENRSDQVRAPWMSLGAHGQAPAPIVVPGLAEDEEQWAPQQDSGASDEAYQPAAFEQGAPLGGVEQAPAEPEAYQPAAFEQGAPLGGVEQAPAEPEAYQPAAFEQGAPLGGVEQAPAEPEAYQPAAFEQGAPLGGVEQAPAEPEAYQPAAFEQGAPLGGAHAVDAPAQYEPAPFEPASYEPAPFEPAAFEPAVHEPAAFEPVADEPAAYDAPAFEPSGYEQHVPAEETVAAPAAAPQWFEAPAFEAPVFDQAASAAVVDEPESTAYDAPAAYEAAAYVPTYDAPAEPAAQTPASDEQAAAQSPVAPAPAPVSYTAYSGYAGWAAPTQTPDPQAPFDFERTLDEARAWHTGALPTVAEPAAPVVEQPAAVAEPAPVVEQPTDQPEPVAQAQAEPVAQDVPAWEPPAWEPPSWEAPTQLVEPIVEPVLVEEPVEAYAAPAVEPVQEQSFAVPALAEDPADAPQWAETTPAWGAPAWPSLADAEAPAESPAPVAEPQPQAYAAPTPAPEPVAPAVSAAPAPAFGGFGATGLGDMQAPAAAQPAPAAEDDRPRKKWGLFGRRKPEAETAAPAAASFAPSPAPVEPAPEPVRTSAWSAPAEPAAPAPAAAPSWSAPQWSAPEAPAPAAPEPVAAAPAAGWAPPEWAASRPAAPAPAPQAAVDVPNPMLPPSVAPRIGTLDDNVAAMLALRSDIQEQALSELSQLSAYRPAANSSGERLTKRVPTAIPQTAAEPSTEAPVQRDANELRSRLSSFQSGTSRGRQAAGPNDTPRTS